MKPFILKFKETPTQEDHDYSLIEYNERLNLSVLKNTETPAIDFSNLETETFTKTQGEGADSDKSGLSVLMDTITSTFIKSEDSDSDNDDPWPSEPPGPLKKLLDTTTITETSENSDQDR